MSDIPEGEACYVLARAKSPVGGEVQSVSALMRLSEAAFWVGNDLAKTYPTWTFEIVRLKRDGETAP
jgi:hypothetical protein